MASERDGSLYVWDHNFIRKVTPGRDDIASILETRYEFCETEGIIAMIRRARPLHM
jgi:hypothetical protein